MISADVRRVAVGAVGAGAVSEEARRTRLVWRIGQGSGIQVAREADGRGWLRMRVKDNALGRLGYSVI